MLVEMIEELPCCLRLQSDSPHARRAGLLDERLIKGEDRRGDSLPVVGRFMFEYPLGQAIAQEAGPILALKTRQVIVSSFREPAITAARQIESLKLFHGRPQNRFGNRLRDQPTHWNRPQMAREAEAVSIRRCQDERLAHQSGCTPGHGAGR